MKEARRRSPRARSRTGFAPLLLAWLALPACGGGSAAADEKSPASLLGVEATRVEAQPGYTVDERFAGRVMARRQSELGFERSARVVEIRVDEGASVEPGQALARLETRELEARRRELEARLAGAEAQLALARRTSDRRETLVRRETISAQAWDEARFQEESLRAELAAAQASLEAVGVSLELSVLRAPYAGTVTARRVDEGTPVAAGQAVLRLIENDHLELRVGLPPEAAAGLEQGHPERATADAGDFEAVLHTLIPSVDPQTRTVTAIFRIPEPPAGLRHGDMARLAVEAERPAEGFWLPMTALAESRRGLWAAFALVPAEEGGGAAGVHRVERRELQLVHAEADRAFVRGTLRDGERVVATGLHRLVPGQRVRALP